MIEPFTTQLTNNGFRQRRLAALVACLLALGAAAAPPAETSNLDRYLERQMRKARVPGLATAIVLADEVVQAEGYGLADPATGLTVTPDTSFQLASVSKLVMATAAMRLVDRKRLDLDADINDSLPFEVRNPSFPTEPITLRQLLTHTSSISDEQLYDRLNELTVVGDWPGTLVGFAADYLTPAGRYYDPQASYRPYAPGTGVSYSNVGFALVGALVESVTGSSLEEYMRAAVLSRLDMTSSSWRIEGLDPDQMAVPCNWVDGEFETWSHLSLAVGLLRASATDMANFASMHLMKGRFAGRRVLKRRTVRDMVQVQFPALDPERGLAFGLEERGNHRYAFHRGGFVGATTSFRLGLDEAIGVIVLTNGEAWHTPRSLRAFEKIEKRLLKEARRIIRRRARQAEDP